MTSSTVMPFCKALRRVHIAWRAQQLHYSCVWEKESRPRSMRQTRFSMAKLMLTFRPNQIARMGHGQRPCHRLHPTSRHPRRRNAGARRALFCPPFDPTALRPLPREESGLLRGRRGICLCQFIWEDCKGECYAFTRKAIATDTQEG